MDMSFESIASKEHLKEPYDSLAEALSIPDICHFAKYFGKRDVYFGGNINETLTKYPLLVQIMGREKAEIIASTYAGETIYFPELRSALSKAIHEKLRDEFNGGNQTALAIKYGYSDRQIRNILKDMPKRQLVDERQMTIDDFFSHSGNFQYHDGGTSMYNQDARKCTL